ncbi:MAG: hypothetical protein RLZZ524_3260 [Pseudomonadota bacterium]|jgi:hypothetical protein
MTWNDAVERVRARLHNRAFSYRALFKPTGELAPTAAIVLRDLAHYCYVNKPTLKVSPITGQTDAYAMAFAEGRRDVFNRITSLANLTPDQIDRIANQRGNED